MTDGLLTPEAFAELIIKDMANTFDIRIWAILGKKPSKQERNEILTILENEITDRAPIVQRFGAGLLMWPGQKALEKAVDRWLEFREG
jgi:hypothetical protein